MRARLALSLAFTAALLGTAVDARADGDAEGAKKHFEIGRKLRGEDDCGRAIPEFEKSLAADKSIGAYYNLGYCQEQLGHRQEAYDAYRRAREMASAKKDDRLKEISGALAALMETPNVRLVLPQPLPSGFVLQVDGETVPSTLFQDETVIFTKSTPTHNVRATAPGYDDTVLTVDRQLKAIEMKETAKNVVAPSVPKTEHEVPFYRRPVFGGILGITGFVAATTGAILGIKTQLDIDAAKDKSDASLAVCSKTGGPLTPAECKDMKNAGSQQAAYIARSNDHNAKLEDGRSTFVFVVLPLAAGGLVLMGAGAYILWTAKSAAAEAAAGAVNTPKTRPIFTPLIGPTFGGAAMSLSF